MKEIKCPNCGGKLKDNRCEYCGCFFEDNTQNIDAEILAYKLVRDREDLRKEEERRQKAELLRYDEERSRERIYYEEQLNRERQKTNSNEHYSKKSWQPSGCLIVIMLCIFPPIGIAFLIVRIINSGR